VFYVQLKICRKTSQMPFTPAVFTTEEMLGVRGRELPGALAASQ
jgi:hypothetical protein